MVTENTKWISANNYLTAVIATVLFLIFIPLYGFVGAAIAYLLSMIIQLILTVKASKRHYDMMIDFRPIIYMIAVSIVGYYVSNVILKTDNLYISIAIKSFLYLILTGIVIYIMWHYSKEKEYILSLVRAFKSKFS